MVRILFYSVQVSDGLCRELAQELSILLQPLHYTSREFVCDVLPTDTSKFDPWSLSVLDQRPFASLRDAIQGGFDAIHNLVISWRRSDNMWQSRTPKVIGSFLASLRSDYSEPTTAACLRFLE